MAWLLFELLQSYLDSNNEGHEGQMITIFRKEKTCFVLHSILQYPKIIRQNYSIELSLDRLADKMSSR